MAKPLYRQSGVLPIRVTDGAVQLLLITSLRSRRWIIPKGIVEPDLTAPESAEKEAYEEAGITGDVDEELVGTYRYDKWGGTCEVAVYRMVVRQILDEWPEDGQRDRKWMSLAEAAGVIREPELVAMLESL